MLNKWWLLKWFVLDGQGFWMCPHALEGECIECDFSNEIPLSSDHCTECNGNTWVINGLCARCQPPTVGCG